jgi:hypothetical protein
MKQIVAFYHITACGRFIALKACFWLDILGPIVVVRMFLKGYSAAGNIIK